MAHTKDYTARGRDWPHVSAGQLGTLQAVQCTTLMKSETVPFAADVRSMPVPRDRHESIMLSGPKQPLRILHIVPFFARGGTELILRRLISGLDVSEFDHYICAMRGFDPDFVSSAGLGSRFLCVGRSEERFQFPLFRLTRMIRSLRPHIVHTRNWGALEAVLAARLAGVPGVLHSEHGYDLDMVNGLPWRRRAARRAFYSLTDDLFTVSNELRDFHASQVSLSRARIRVFYNGVDTSRFSPRVDVRASIRAELGIPPSSVLIGSVGRMVAIKDYPLTLSVASELLQRGRDFCLLLVGNGPELDRLQQSVRDNAFLQGRVHFQGFSERVPDLLGAMDIFVQSSRAEGMSNTLLEAMSCGLPVIATRVGGNPEVVSECETGLLFSPGDHAALAEHMDTLIRLPDVRQRFGESGRSRVLQHFSIERMLSQYRDLYLDLAIRRNVSQVSV
jgi:sugar transferase (PEP-CTERM/EpsH1 system associated)